MTVISVRKMARLLALWPLAINVLSALVIIPVLALDGHPAAIALIAIPLLLVIWRQRTTLFSKPRGMGGAGRYQTARFLLAGASLVQLHAMGALGWLGGAALLLAVVTVAGEMLLRSFSSKAVPYAVHVPDYEPRNRSRLAFGVVYQIDVAALAVLVVSPLLPAVLVPLSVLLFAGSLVVLVIGLLDVIGRIRERRRFQANLPGILESLAPVFYIYWNAPAKSAFQVTMWLPYLERLGVPFAIVVRTVGNLRQLQNKTDRPVILRRSMGDLDHLIVPSVRGVFYVNNAMRNNHMVRYSDLTHIQLLHGESDKAASATPIIRMYDRDFVAGQAAIDRFEKFGVPMPPEIFRIVGRPQVEDVQQERAPMTEIDAPSVLYAPTWAGYQAETNYSSLLAGPAIVRGLLDRGCTVVFRPHPYASRAPELAAACREIRTILEMDREATGREHLFGAVAQTQMSVVDCFNAADAMISDVSAVVGDFLHSGKPLAMVSPRSGAEEFVEQFPMARAAYVLQAEGTAPVGLDALLDELVSTDPGREERQKWADYYLGDIPRENYADRFVQVAREELGLDPQQDAVPPMLGQRASAT